MRIGSEFGKDGSLRIELSHVTLDYLEQ